jgi:hypothetical protein
VFPLPCVAAGGQPHVEHRPQDRGGSGGIETGQIDQPLDIRAVDERAVSRIERSGGCAPRVEHRAVQIDEELLNEPRPEDFGRDRRRKGADVERVAPDCGIGGRVLERAMGFDPREVGHAEGPRWANVNRRSTKWSRRRADSWFWPRTGIRPVLAPGAGNSRARAPLS